MSIKLSSITLPGCTDIKENPLPILRHKEEHVKVEHADNIPKDIADGFGKYSGARVLPYKMQSHYHRATNETQLLTIIYENDVMRATFLPEYGGRLYSLYNKQLDKELLSVNPVFQPANLATRNAWFSGGIEWNMAHYGHTYLTCEPLFFATCTTEDGEPFLRMYEYERVKKLFYQIDFHLPDGSDHLIAYTKIINPYDHKTPIYYWSNTAVSELANARVFSATDEVVYVMPYLDDNGKMVNTMASGTLPHLKGLKGDVSYPRNYERSNEYFYQNPSDITYPWEAVGYNDGSLFYECSTMPLRYRKMFCWGTHRGGTKWQDYLSHNAEDKYVEIQAGLYPTQLHSDTMDANSTISFMQLFGMATEMDTNILYGSHDKATNYVYDTLFSKHTESSLKAKETYVSAQSILPVTEVFTYGRGWGALELLRAKKEGNPIDIPSMDFPESSINEEQDYWLSLLDTAKGDYTEQSLDMAIPSYMIDENWMTYLDTQIDSSDKPGEVLLLHKGLMLSEMGNDKDAIELLEKYATNDASLLYLRTIGAIYQKLNLSNDALLYYTKAFDKVDNVNAAFVEEDFISEYLSLLVELEHFDVILKIYQLRLDAHKVITEEMQLSIASAAYALKKWHILDDILENAAPERHREGNNILVELWFKRQAGLKDITVDEARLDLTPPDNIDFRMS